MDQCSNPSTTDTDAALEFIKQWFGATESPVYLSSLPNEKNDDSEPGERHVATRDSDKAADFITKFDRPKRGLFFCVSTIRAGMPRNKDNVTEIAGLHADIDFKDESDTPDSILKRLKTLPLPPSHTVQSGNGIHCYWQFKEALVIDGAETIERVEAALKLLCDLVGGDDKVCHVASLMRLPGSHNTKFDCFKEVTVESSGFVYELSDIEEMLWITSPIVLRKLRPSPTAEEINPYAAIMKSLGFKPPIDAEKRLAAMAYMAGGESSIHETQIEVSASLLLAGREIDEVVSIVKDATRSAAGAYGARWNWTREEKEIRNACYTWLKKHPREAKAGKAAPKTATGSATVHSLADARAKKEEPKPKSQKVIDRENFHIAIGQAVLQRLAEKGTPIIVVDGQLWRYADGLWTEPSNHGRHDLEAEIETCIRGNPPIVSNTKLVTEVRNWIFRNPDIYRSSMQWDDHGKIAVIGGLIDIKTLEFEPAKPEHHITARANTAYDAAAQCPVWLEMLESTFADRDDTERAATIGMIQEILGCALIEEKSKALSRALIFHGASNTGKTDLIKTMSGLLTDHPISTPIGMLDGTHGLMEFHRKAPWVLHEAFKAGAWHFSDVVKSILSGDPVQINVKNGALTTQRIRQPIFWGSNYPPQFKEATRAIINRIVVLSTGVVFDPKVAIGVALKARVAGFAEPSDLILATEKPGLLNWALAGLRRALERGYFAATTEMEATLEAVRLDSNLVAGFLDEHVEFDPDYMISTSDFCAAFTAWWIENKGENRGAPSNDSISRQLQSLADPRVGIDHKALRDNKRRYYAGIHLNESGMDYWHAAVADGLAPGKTSGTSTNLVDLNRHIPPSWASLPVILKLKNRVRETPTTPPIF